MSANGGGATHLADAAFEMSVCGTVVGVVLLSTAAAGAPLETLVPGILAFAVMATFAVCTWVVWFDARRRREAGQHGA